MAVRDEIPDAVAIEEDLYRVPRHPVDVFIRTSGREFMVFAPICDLAGARRGDFPVYLLERNASPKVMPGAFAIYDGKVVYRMFVPFGQLADACARVLTTTQAYAPKILPML